MISIRLLLLACVIIWGWTFVATKICLSSLSPFELVGMRFLIGTPILYAVVRSKGIRINFPKAAFRPLIIGSVIITAHFFLQAVALNYTTATNTGWLVATSPLALAVMGVLFLGERIGWREILAIMIATVGVLLLISNGALDSFSWLSNTGDWLILVSAVTWALYTIATRNLSRTYDPLAVTLALFLPLAAGCLLYIIFGGVPSLQDLPVDVLLALLFLAIPGTLAQWLWQIGIVRLGASRAGFFLYLEPLATTVLAVPLLGDSFTPFTAIGGSLVILGVWFAQTRGLRPVRGEG